MTAARTLRPVPSNDADGDCLPGEFPVPGSPRYRYTPGSGVWQGRDLVLPWCPLVTRHLAAYSSREQVTRRQITVRVGEEETTVPMREVTDGSVWSERFTAAPGTAGFGVRDALTNIIDDQASRLPPVPLHPRWEGGALVLPPGDVLPRGFGESAGTVEDWRALLREIARSPRMALATGLALGGLYVRPLGRQSFMVHLPGASSEGKTTTMQAAAAMFGNPETVILPWSVTKQGPGAWLRSMALLTGFRDELGAAGFSPAQLESAVFGFLQGAERDMSTKTGDHRESQGSWHGSLMSSGNESVIGQIANEGIAARVVEITGPLTLDQPHADTVAKLARQVHGHGLAALVERGPSPDRFAELITEQLAEISAPDGGVPFRIASHLSVGVAGVLVLAELSGVPEFAVGVIEAARAVLAELVAGLAERGMRPGDRLLAALAGSMAAEPTAWPTRLHYEKAVSTGEATMAREIYGWDLIGDTLPGEVAVISTQLRGLALEAGINDPGIALRELRKRDLLVPARDGRHLAQLVKVAGKPKRAYLFHGITPEDPGAEPGTGETPLPPGPGAPAAEDDDARERERPCAVCLTPGMFCGSGGVAQEGLDRPCSVCGAPTLVRSACGAARHGHCIPAPPLPVAEPVAVAPEPPAPTCRECGQKLHLIKPGRDLCERCRLAAEKLPEPPPTVTGATATPEPQRTPRGASPAAQARTQGRTATLATSKTALANGEPLRLLAALETSHAPRRKTEVDGQMRMRGPLWSPELPGMIFAAQVVDSWAWNRRYDGPTVTLDRSGAFVAAAASVEVAHGALEHTGPLTEWDKTRTGYALTQVYPWPERDSMPHPLGTVRKGAEIAWVPGPTIGLLRELADAGRWPDVPILDSYTGDPVRLNQGKWTDLLRDLRAQAIGTYGRDSDQYAEVKQAIGQCWSLMLGRDREAGVGREWKCRAQRPDWTHAVKTQASAMLWRWADACRIVAPDYPPVAVRNVDELVIPVEALEVVKTIRAPGRASPLIIDQDGIKLGSFKVKAADHG